MGKEIKVVERTKTRYSRKELGEFRSIINDKLIMAREDFRILKSGLTQEDSNDTIDTSPTFHLLNDGNLAQSREETGRLAQRQKIFIQSLESALVRIENGTYGICRETGKLIPKQRLMVVPHTTLCVEVKKDGEKKVGDIRQLQGRSNHPNLVIS